MLSYHTSLRPLHLDTARPAVAPPAPDLGELVLDPVDQITRTRDGQALHLLDGAQIATTSQFDSDGKDAIAVDFGSDD